MVKTSLRVKLLHIETGSISIVVLNSEQAKDLDLKHLDRVRVYNHKKSIICSVDITKIAVKKGEIGLFVEPESQLGFKDGEELLIESVPKPKGLSAIREKLDGKELSKEDLYDIVKNIVDDELSDVELTAFITASYCKGLSFEETYNLTKAMVETGEVLNFGKGPVFDKHSIGGVPGNRVTMVLIPIVASQGIKIPKTSSRAITSPSGTADTVEVLCPVTLSKEKIKSIVDKFNGCMVWGGSFNLAPADDKIIKVEKPLSIDAEGQMLASILAKKISVGSNHIVIDLPIGPGTKLPTHEKSEHLTEMFINLGKKLGVKIECIESNGSQPCGNGVGPALEVIDVLKILTNEPSQPMDLREKSLMFAAKIFEMSSIARKGKGIDLARKVLESGEAYAHFKKIIKAQGGNPDVKISDIKVGSFVYEYKTNCKGIITMINNKAIADIARAAGAPYNKGAGVFVKSKLSDLVNENDTLMVIHSESREKLLRAIELLNDKKVFTVQ
ncbi:MAG: AMP phosphorylase [Candidatus Nanoarchaeia archaeon]|jgi:AMP phosphorylase